MSSFRTSALLRRGPGRRPGPGWAPALGRGALCYGDPVARNTYAGLSVRVVHGPVDLEERIGVGPAVDPAPYGDLRAGRKRSEFDTRCRGLQDGPAGLACAAGHLEDFVQVAFHVQGELQIQTSGRVGVEVEDARGEHGLVGQDELLVVLGPEDRVHEPQLLDRALVRAYAHIVADLERARAYHDQAVGHVGDRVLQGKAQCHAEGAYQGDHAGQGYVYQGQGE